MASLLRSGIIPAPSRRLGAARSPPRLSAPWRLSVYLLALRVPVVQSRREKDEGPYSAIN